MPTEADRPRPEACDDARSGMYLIVELEVRDADALRRYAKDVRPLVEKHGGKIVAISTTGGDVIEGERRPRVIALHRWPSRSHFDAFYGSPEYQPLKELRHASCETRLVAVSALPE